MKLEDIMNASGIDLVMIINLSGSTSSPISAQDENGNNLESGFSINDILRHTGKTVKRKHSLKYNITYND